MLSGSTTRLLTTTLNSPNDSFQPWVNPQAQIIKRRASHTVPDLQSALWNDEDEHRWKTTRTFTDTRSVHEASISRFGDELTWQREVVREGFAQSPKTTQAPGMRGTFFESYVDILATHGRQLLSGPENSWMLRPISSFTKSELAHYEGLSTAERTSVDRLHQEQTNALKSFIDEIVKPVLRDQILTEGVVHFPSDYIPQDDVRTCTVATFRMIVKDITGKDIPEGLIFSELRSRGLLIDDAFRAYSVPDKILWSLVNTNAFHKEFPDLKIRYRPFTGMSFQDIKNLRQHLNDRGLQSAKIYCRLSIASEISSDGWHDIILISADENTVVIHDPSNIVGAAYRHIPKDIFSERWAKTMCGGSFIIVID